MPIPSPRPVPLAPAGPDRGRAFLRAALWAVLVAILLWLPGGGGLSSWPLLRRLGELADAGGDKVVHAALFAVQAWLLCRARGERAGWLAASFVLAALYGAVTELGQVFVVGRDAGFGDGAADIAGAALGVWVHAIGSRRSRRNR
jgi:hypothetical protein